MDFSDDITICDNPVADFLRQTLHKVQNETRKIEETIDFISKETDDLLNNASASSKGVKLSSPVVKLYRHKYVLWFQLENSRQMPMKNFELLLHWTSDDEFTYVTSMQPAGRAEGYLDEPLIYIDTLVKKAFLVVTFDRPSFVLDHTIQIDGFLSYSDETAENYVDDIQPILIRSTDITTKSIRISAIEDHDVTNFHTRLIGSFKVDLVLQLLSDVQISSALTHASFIPYGSLSKKSRRFYAVTDDCFCFDGTILEVTESNVLPCIFDISVYTKDGDSLLALYHHLHQSIKPLVLLPSEYKFCITTNKDPKVKEEILNRCLDDEIRLLVDYTKNSNELHQNYPKMREVLVDMEYKTDLAYVEYLRSHDEKQGDSQK